MNRVKLLAILMSFAIGVSLVAGVVVDTVRIIDLSGHLTADEHKTCLVQGRGLKANRYLVDSLQGIHALLTLPRTPQQREQAALTPPRELARELRVVGALNANLAHYVRIERKQPKSRTC